MGVEFEVVSDELRTQDRERNRAEWVAAVLAGKTVKINLPQAKLGGYYKMFSKEGVRLRTRSDGEQTIVWAELPKSK